jgi:hypothetical protein
MANDKHVALLKQGVAAWNPWREENPNIRPDLSGADLREAYLRRADLREADLREADLSKASLSKANLSKANLRRADLSKANLRRADLSKANLSGADLSEADLRGANLLATTLVGTDLTGADLTGCRIYGVSAWRLKLERAKQQNLVITPPEEPTVTVDKIEVAQFVYLLLHNENLFRDQYNALSKRNLPAIERIVTSKYQRGAAFNREHPFVDVLLSDITESGEVLDVSELQRETSAAWPGGVPA